MPNWCNSYIVIYGENKECVKDFNNKIKEWVKKPITVKNEWTGTSTWLGNIITRACSNTLPYLLSYEELAKNKNSIFHNVKHRGEIFYVGGYEERKDIGLFCLKTETAWCQMIKMWRMIIEHLYPNKGIKLAYTAEERNTDYYVKYDPDMIINPDKDLYYVDSYITPWNNTIDTWELDGISGDVSGEEIKNILNKMGIKESEINNPELNNMIEEKMLETGYHEDDYFRIYKYHDGYDEDDVCRKG